MSLLTMCNRDLPSLKLGQVFACSFSIVYVYYKRVVGIECISRYSPFVPYEIPAGLKPCTTHQGAPLFINARVNLRFIESGQFVSMGFNALILGASYYEGLFKGYGRKLKA